MTFVSKTQGKVARRAFAQESLKTEDVTDVVLKAKSFIKVAIRVITVTVEKLNQMDLIFLKIMKNCRLFSSKLKWN